MKRKKLETIKETSIRSKLIFIIITILVTIFLSYFALTSIDLGSEEKPMKIIFIPKLIDNINDFWIDVIAGSEMAAKEYNVDFTIVAPNREDDYEGQNNFIDWAIRENPDAIVLAPVDYNKTMPLVEKIKENDIELILVDSNVKEKVEDVLIATDNFEAGKEMGRYILNYIEEDTQIAIVSYVKTASTAIERQAGVREGLGKEAEKIVEVVYCDSDYDKAYNLTKELLERNPNINMVIGLNEYSSTGAFRALKEVDRYNSINAFGFDSTTELIKFLEGNVCQGLMIQKPFNMGYLGIEKAVRLLKGEDLPEYIDSGFQLITQDNMYTKENQKLLFPFE
ncbi:MAG: ABC transporter substrate-binding protein [Clostridiales bacterium]|jgi:ribose transport system substrate-binding protein|nr:ABC transporter substrate-binding protein [Clostridiales bacterium]